MIDSASSQAITRSEKVMEGTVANGETAGHPPQAASQILRPLPTRLARVAADLHVSESVASKGLYGEHAWNLLYAQVIESDLRAGDHRSVDAWVAPGLAAEEGAEIPDFMRCLREYDEADLDEDKAELDLNHKCLEQIPSNEIATYIRAAVREARKALRCAAAGRRVLRAREVAR